MLGCPSKTFFGNSLRNLGKIENTLYSDKDKFLFGFCLDLEVEFLLTVIYVIRLFCQIN